MESVSTTRQNRVRAIVEILVLGGIGVLVGVLVAICIVVVLKRYRTTKAFMPSFHIDTVREKLQLLHKYAQQLKANDKLSGPTIFVAISSYRDPELCLTLRDLYFLIFPNSNITRYEKCLFPERITFGVVEQNDTTDDRLAFAQNAGLPDRSLRLKQFNHTEAKGPTWARFHCEQLWQGEEYHLMTDSHMRSEPGWDIQLLEMLYKCPRPQRTVLTCYPEGYERNEENGKVTYKILMRKGFRFVRFKYFNPQGIPEFESVTTTWPIPRSPPLCPFWGACFHFSHSDSIRLCPFSPNTPYLFFGEEIFMAARYWTAGFDIRLPTHSVVYHLWKRDYRKTYWSHDVITERDKSIKLVKDILTGVVVDNVHGLGTIRTWQQFWDYVGLDPHALKTTRSVEPWVPGEKYKPLCDTFGCDKRA